MDRPKILVITGPTASGKSALALEVARHFGGEIINADSMQVYKYMDIGTAKPSAEERKLVEHHLIDILYPDETFSAALFREEAQGVIARLQREGKRAVVAGGTGLYIKALTSGLIKGGEVDDTIRGRLQLEAQSKEGRQHLYQRLSEVDPITASKLHPHDTYRVIRALEVYERTGHPISALRREHLFQEQPYKVLKIGLIMERKELYRRIDQRVDEMIQRGLKDEVRRLLEMGYSPSLKTMQALGYKQMVEHLLGGCDLSEAVRRIKRDTRRYAKRQITWFGADAQIHWAEYPKDKDAIFRMIEGFWEN
ncbi:MAG: tRNA (adenosine(37)-N6)-dimethylallyltransferase MiaA [Deltaproteobacteria bacterium]|nr:MAG: tRNA (adenosine(37)-N6)-dimethylallyltransferase MiaA [Deltaproteobacteria bacterium]